MHGYEKKAACKTLCSYCTFFIPLSWIFPFFLISLYAALVFALVLTLMSTFMLASMPVPVFYSRSHTVLSSCCIPALISCLGSPAILLSCHTFVFCCKIPAFLLLLPSMLNPPLLFRSSPLKTFKRFLSNEPWPHVSTSFAKHLCLFLALGAYNPDNNNSLHNSTNNNKRK